MSCLFQSPGFALCLFSFSSSSRVHACLSFCLQEEIRDTDLFWNRITMKKALIMGAAFATQMGDSASAAAYASTMNAINATLYSSHWTGAYIQETQQRTRDGAVIVGLNDGYDSSDRLFAPTSFEVASTVAAYNSLFCRSVCD